ncbi:hypothetical protein DKG77_05855 [Flagellimonas aquimarina]|uniref:Uncharacterized protein n=1 Tax=Flagellimonas aquimarina TaxID=2201895 RepID=A0A316L1G1_9FLAO|nr:hypothetical protein [Allomuricauda koreensis]PWL40342.1 hypothetical protein DKG77_05855 [Allomuricauda koreensis]
MSKNEMNVFFKTLLSIPSIVGIAYMISFWSIDFLKWISNNLVDFQYQAPIVNGLTLLQIGILIYRLWTYKNLPKEKKTNWTIFLVVFNVIASLIFIWKKDYVFEKMDKSTSP